MVNRMRIRLQPLSSQHTAFLSKTSSAQSLRFAQQNDNLQRQSASASANLSKAAEVILFNLELMKPNLKFDKAGIGQYESKYDALIEQKVAELDQIDFAATVPFIKKSYRNLGMAFDIGIPPIVEQIKASDPSGKKLSTGGVLSYIALEAIKQYPNAASLEEAITQLFVTYVKISQLARKKPVSDWDLLSKGLTREKDYSPTGPSLAGIRKDVYNSFQKGHMVFITPNGAISILRIPTAEALIGIIQSDPTLQKEILKTQPLMKRWMYKVADIRLKSMDQLYTLLREESKGEHPKRIGREGVTDTHALLQHVPFNISRYMKEGRLQEAFKKPGGQDNLSVWEWLESNPETGALKKVFQYLRGWLKVTSDENGDSGLDKIA